MNSYKKIGTDFFEIDRSPDTFKKTIHNIIKKYHKQIITNTENTQIKMDNFDNPHHFIYKIFYTSEKIKEMEYYHNVARILSSNVGRLFDEIIKFSITIIEGGRSTYIVNPTGKPKKFEIDILNENKKIAYEIKWRDAGTDGDHKNKEFTKVDLIKQMGYKPIRLTFYLPELAQSLLAQKNIINYYKTHGEAYTGEEAFDYINKMANIDLIKIISEYEFL